MPYQVKSPSAINSGDVFWKGNITWTETYADRLQFSAQADANAVKNTKVTKNGVTYAPKWFENSTVVTE